jgi:hypothetical protein
MRVSKSFSIRWESFLGLSNKSFRFQEGNVDDMMTPLFHQQGNKALVESGLIEKEWME